MVIKFNLDYKSTTGGASKVMSEKDISLDLSNVYSYVSQSDIYKLQPFVSTIHHMIENKTGEEKDLLGWVDLPINYDKEEFNRIKIAAKKIRDTSDIFIVIGVGGSYLGARAAIEMLSHTFNNILPKDKRQGPVILYAGNNMSPTYMKDLLESIEGMDLSINIISKSGTTLEPSLAFRTLKNLMEKKYGKEASRHRIYTTTDREKGALKALADKEGYKTFCYSRQHRRKIFCINCSRITSHGSSRDQYRGYYARCIRCQRSLQQ